MLSLRRVVAWVAALLAPLLWLLCCWLRCCMDAVQPLAQRVMVEVQRLRTLLLPDRRRPVMAAESRNAFGTRDGMVTELDQGKNGAVALETGEGTELLLHGPGPVYADGGTITIPAALLAGGHRESQ